MAKVWLQLLQLKEEEAVDRKELLQLWQQMAQLLQDSLKEGEQDFETQQCVRFPQMRTVIPKICLLESTCSIGGYGTNQQQVSLKSRS